MITDFRRAASVEEAVALQKEGYRYLAGGTQLNNAARRGSRAAVERVVSLDNLGLNQIKAGDGAVTVGAGVTLQQLADSSVIPDVLRRAAAFIPTRSVRNMATIGGNIAARRPDSYIVPTLIALDALVETVEGDIPVEEYITGESSALILNIRVPEVHGVCHAVKESRSFIALPVVSAAVRIAVESGVVTEARIAAGCIAPRTVRLTSLEAQLASGSFTLPADMESLERGIAAAIDPPEDFLGSTDYKRYVNAVVIADCISACIREASS